MWWRRCTGPGCFSESLSWGLHTGLGCGEVLGLTWAAIDAEKGELDVTRELLRVDGAYQLPERKSWASRRTVR